MKPLIASTLIRLGDSRRQQERPEETLPFYQEAWALSRDARPVGSGGWQGAWRRYVECLVMLGRHRQAVTVLTDVCGRLDSELGPDDSRTADARSRLAALSGPG